MSPSVPKPSPRPTKARKPVRRSNAKRRAREFRRVYFSVERVEFVKRLPCASCGIVGFSENAHIEGHGTGYKAGYQRIAPLCGAGVYRTNVVTGKWEPSEGCHRAYDRHRLPNFPKDKAEAAAIATEAAWLAFHSSTENA